mgnify:CR=1 FL=1
MGLVRCWVRLVARLRALLKGVTVAVSVAGGAVLGGALNEGAKLQQSTGGVENAFLRAMQTR